MRPVAAIELFDRHEIGTSHLAHADLPEPGIVLSRARDGQFRYPAGTEDCSNLVKTFMDRIAALNEVLTENPKDAFARYGLAMEYSKQGDLDRALAEFSILLENHPDYTAGYFMAAQTLARAERTEEAKKMLAEGIASAKRTGNLHAQSEMEGLLADLSR